MTMPNVSAPPIHELPVEIEAALSAYATTCFLRGVYDKVREGSLEETEGNLRNAIHAALSDQDAALRERAERLRQGVLHAATLFSPDLLFGTNIRESDLADNLRPRGGDER